MNGGAWRPISKDEYDHLKARGETGLDWIEGVGHVVYDRQAFEEFRSASDRIAAREKASAVVVKPLEWDAHGRADVYSVVKDNLRSPPDFFMARGDKIIDHYSDETEAKAAAQADYEARIESALVEVPPVKGEPEPVAWLRYATEGDAPTPCNEDDDGAFAVYRTAPPADAGMRWRHKKRGSTYTEIGRGTMQCSANALIDMQPVVIYRSEHDGSLWVRGVVEFEDGRFEALTAPGATTKSDGGGEERR